MKRAANGASGAAFVDYAPLLRPGETANVICLAVDRQQAKIVHRYAKAYFECAISACDA